MLTRLDELSRVLDHAAARQQSLLQTLSGRVAGWRVFVAKQKATYRVLNMWNYDLTRKVIMKPTKVLFTPPQPVTPSQFFRSPTCAGADRRGLVPRDPD